ncbi:MAG TPA: hypothetical protein VGB50_11845 [Flavobacterium sp.]|jgi:hypothetical protein
MIFLEITQPLCAYALTGGPSQPEFESFTPIGTSDMVDLASGDFNYNIPVMDVGGYPLNLSYNSGVTMDQEASWVGLGWDLNVGQIGRQLRGLPDDFNGDEMTYENNLKDNVTIGSNVNVFVSGFGVGENLSGSVGMGVKYNNYDGFGFAVNGGMSFQVSDNLKVGMEMESSASDGVSVSPSISYSKKFTDSKGKDINLGSSLGVSYNSRKGVESMSMSFKATKDVNNTKGIKVKTVGPDISGSISFVDASFTPTKRVGMMSSNYMFNMNIEGEIWGVEPGFKFSGYRTSQGIRDSEKYKTEKAYGFENSYNAGGGDIMDFNREKDRTFNKNTTSLPITNNTYDIYSVQGQGIAGMFRPYKSQVSYVRDSDITDYSNGGSLGAELGPGTGVHVGVDATVTYAESSTNNWRSENNALNRFYEKKNNAPDYEKVFFKNIGGTHVDNDMALFNSGLGDYDPVKFDLAGSKFSRSTTMNYYKNGGAAVAGTGKLVRGSRVNRNQTIQKFNRQEAQKYHLGTLFSPYCLSGRDNHHTAEVRVTKEGGERYVYGRAAYNITKKEATFDVGERTPNCVKGLVAYGTGDNSINNHQSGDRYFNRVTTPGYAHTYLLTSVLSPDYQDLKDDGPTDDDLGAYTKFTYEDKTAGSPYKWRMPFGFKQANYDEGLKSSQKDNKGNYVYGEKEVLYIKKIETKTHVAIFHISARNDAHGVAGEDGGLGAASKMYKLDKISLYSKPEYLAYLADSDPANDNQIVPIKEAHFVYNYKLCPGVENFHDETSSVTEVGNGKLTLTKMYFTYKKSNMGKYTPYVFNYGNLDDPADNPAYNFKAYDVWGNYKPQNSGISCSIDSPLTNAEFPYVDQSNREQADRNASVWCLKRINLPSGGEINLQFESDDYSHVQNKEVMQMFKVVGAGDDANPGASELFSTTLNGSKDFLYVELDSGDMANGYEAFLNRAVRPLVGQDVYFRFLTNMSEPTAVFGGDRKYDYVTGYLRVKDPSNTSVPIPHPTDPTKHYAAIPIDMAEQGDGLDPHITVHPVSKAGWFFGRQNLYRVVYAMDTEENTDDLKGVVMQLIGWIPTIFDIFKSPNGKLRSKGIAAHFKSGKSWIRLMQPDRKKVGGGARVKQITIQDQWEVMTDHEDDSAYKQSYGQQYSYTMENEAGSTSGVAAYEPLGSKENPFVQPFYDKRKRDLLLGPENENYVEMPMGESFFPAPKITYRRVSVRNLPRQQVDENVIVSAVRKHATGNVVTEFYTSFDYPTLTDLTTPSAHYDQSNLLFSLLNINVRDHLTMTQGYAVHTNDMDGKMKRQRVYAEGQTGFISGMDYNYKTRLDQVGNKGKLDNNIKTINSDGLVQDNLVGVDYDVINDFRQSKTVTHTSGIDFNTATLPLTLIVIVVPIPLPTYSRHESQIRTAVTTKVIHSTGILEETIAYEDGSKVSTKNLAWDAGTGEVLLTETTNEYNDPIYNFSYPAYWAYSGMNQAAKNVNVEWDIAATGADKYKFNGTTYLAADYLIDGDEIWLEGLDAENKKVKTKAWAVNVNPNNFMLIDHRGVKITGTALTTGHMKIIRSGHRNNQMDHMSTVASMRNPINNFGTSGSAFSFFNPDGAGYRIINASAVEYKNTWPAQCECGLPKMRYQNGQLAFEYDQVQDADTDEDDMLERSYNPYLYNILGNWRAFKSYAYLTGRDYTVDATPRKTGFFVDFTPFYSFSGGHWSRPSSNTKWTNATRVNQFNPYGQEIENRDNLGLDSNGVDSLEVYSSAIYGYNNRFPVAVASNTKYKELGFDGFEDYDLSNCLKTTHFNFIESLVPDKAYISTKQAHTGRRSLRVAPGEKIMVKKQVVTCAVAGGTVTKKASKQAKKIKKQ